MKISAVIPVYNEEDSIEPLVREMTALQEPFCPAQILFVDDGSTDNTWMHIGQCSKEHAVITGLRHTVNRGQSAALLTGLRHATGDIIVTMDGDLQNHPKDIPELISQLEEVDCVCGFRAKRRDSLSRRWASRLANTIRNWATHDQVRDTGCSLKAFHRKCIHDLPPLNGMHRFMPAYFRLNGRTITEVPVSHRARRFGVSKYTNLKRLPVTVTDLFGFIWYRKRYLDNQKQEIIVTS
jgi:dolichol-phosphate mannosyltransferase